MNYPDPYPADYFDDGVWMCGEHDIELDPRYGCRYCPPDVNR